MPLPKEGRLTRQEIIDMETELAAVDVKLAALPATPVEADLPDIVEIVADIQVVATSLRSAMETMANILATTRINQ